MYIYMDVHVSVSVYVYVAARVRVCKNARPRRADLSLLTVYLVRFGYEAERDQKSSHRAILSHGVSETRCHHYHQPPAPALPRCRLSASNRALRSTSSEALGFRAICTLGDHV